MLLNVDSLSNAFHKELKHSLQHKNKKAPEEEKKNIQFQQCKMYDLSNNNVENPSYEFSYFDSKPDGSVVATSFEDGVFISKDYGRTWYQVSSPKTQGTSNESTHFTGTIMINKTCLL